MPTLRGDSEKHTIREQTDSYEPLAQESSGGRDCRAAKSDGSFKQFTAAVVFSGLIPIVALIAWASHIAKEPYILDRFAGAKIGGRLTQGQAKALDVICGALLGPLLMATLNFIWFSSAHVAVINEQTRKERGVPLTSLVALSSTYSGSFDLFNLYNLVRGRTWRLGFFAALTVLAAIGRASFSNMIAYEAYFEDHSAEAPATLRSLSDETLAQSVDFLETDPIKAYNYTPTQQAEISGQISALLTGLNFRAASSLLADGKAYIGTNATTNSLDILPPSVVQLVSVPGYRLTTECQPAIASNLAAVKSGGYSTSITALWSMGEEAPSDQTEEGLLLRAQYPGVPETMQGAYNDYYAFVGFSLNKSDIVLAYMASFNKTGRVISSTFGDVAPGAFNMTMSGFRGTKAVMTAWGIRCVLYRQEGTLNYSRGDNQQWNITSSQFRSEKQQVPSLLGDWQTILNYNAPGAVIPGLGPPVGKTAGVPCQGDIDCTDPLNFEMYAQNFLYASARVEQIIYNVAAEDKGRDLPEYSYSVDGAVKEEFYRITYVPLILLFGLLSLIGAAIITGAMLIYTSRTLSTQSFRQVDVLRLVFDSVIGLRHDIPKMTEMKEQDNDTLQEWAKRCFVSYTEEDEKGRRVVRLSNRD